MGVEYVPNLGQFYTVTGPVMYSYGDFMMEPRDSNDIIPGTSITEITDNTRELAFSVFPTVSTKSININLSLRRVIHTEISVYSISGRKITTLLCKNLKPGEHAITWNGKSMPTGIYFITVKTEGKTETRKVSILR